MTCPCDSGSVLFGIFAVQQPLQAAPGRVANDPEMPGATVAVRRTGKGEQATKTVRGRKRTVCTVRTPF